MKPHQPLPRRSFLRLLAAGALGAGAFPSLVRAQTIGLGDPAPSERINVGFIGLGGQGMGLMRNFLNHSGARVVAVCEVDSGRLADARGRVDSFYKQSPEAGCAGYVDYLELIAHPDLDAVVIATPDHWHALQTVHAAQAGKHVYCEKPAATSIPEGRAMADAVRRAGVVCQIGSMQRSMREFQRVVELARNGFLGEIQKITVGLPSGPRAVSGKDLQSWPAAPESLDYERWLGPAPALPYRAERTHYQWRWQFAFGGGQVADWIGHHYDIGALAANVANFQPVSLENISGKFESPSPFVETATAYSFTARYANGIAIDTASSNRGGVRVEGSEGWVYATRGTLEHSSEALRRLILPSHGYKISGGTGSHTDDFLTAIKTRATPRYPVLEGHNVAAVAHLANAALRAGVPDLRWDPATESLLDRPEAGRFLRRTYRATYVMPV